MAEAKTVAKNLAELDDEDIQLLVEKINGHSNEDDIKENLSSLMEQLTSSKKKKKTSKNKSDDDDEKPRKKSSGKSESKTTNKGSSKKTSSEKTSSKKTSSKEPDVGDTLLVDDEEREITKIDDVEGKEVKAKISGKQGKPKGYPLDKVKFKKKGVFAIRSK